MKFPFFKIPTAIPEKWIIRPIIPIRIFGPGESIMVDALIDSGADCSVFNDEIGREIGLNLGAYPIEKLSGIEGGIIPAKLHKIKIQIVGLKEKIEIVARFTESKGVSAILGQEGFFDAYHIKFERTRGIIEITPAKK